MNKGNLIDFGGVLGVAGAWIRRRPIIPAALLGVAIFWPFGVTRTSGQSSEAARASRGSSEAAIERFWTVYHGNDYAAIPEVQSELQAAIGQDPNNPTLYALLGATHFWHIGEYTRDPKPDQNVLNQDMPTAAQLFQRALDLDYNGEHLIGYVNDDHLPGYLGITTFHMGQMANDPNLMAKGDQILDYAVYQFPEFNNFNRWAAHNIDPKDSATYKKALDSLFQAGCLRGGRHRSHESRRWTVSQSRNLSRPEEGLLAGGRYRSLRLRRVHAQFGKWPGQSGSSRCCKSRLCECKIRQELRDVAVSSGAGVHSRLGSERPGGYVRRQQFHDRSSLERPESQLCVLSRDGCGTQHEPLKISARKEPAHGQIWITTVPLASFLSSSRYT
jgi:hypothetical protein